MCSKFMEESSAALAKRYCTAPSGVKPIEPAMGIQLRRMTSFKKVVIKYLTSEEFAAADVPKGHFAIYVGEDRKRFVIPISCLEHPLFKDLLRKAEEEYGFDHPMGYLRVPCREDDFRNIMLQLNSS